MWETIADEKMLAVEEGMGGRLFYDTLALMIVCNILDNTISVTFL